jgi:tetratricopeptide (TPR) repeat protein
MTFHHLLSRHRSWIGALGLAVASAGASAQALEGRVLQVQGGVRIDGAAAQPGQAFKAATISTAVDGRAQLRMADGTVIALAPATQLSLSAGDARQLTLARGGLMLSTGPERAWRIELPGRSIRSNGFLRLQECAAGCAAAPGFYGRVSAGEAVLEYQGGRSVLRNRSFRWAGAAERPEVLATPPALLDSPASLAAVTRARAEVAALLKTGLEHFNAGRDAEAEQALKQVSSIAPGETVVPYYLGLIALRRQDSPQAIALLQQYVREDPEGAAAREVPKTLTLLSSAQLQQEVAAAVAREREVVSTPPEPGSIAVQAFVNQGDEAYRAMAKGLAAMIIADLAKVPGLKVLEREKVQLLVNEAKLGDSGLADKDSAVRSGRLMRAEKVVVGNFEVR